LNNITKNGLKTLAVITLAAGVSACGGSANDRIIDSLDKKYDANISYVNAIDDATTFYLKSRLYAKSVYDNDFKIIEITTGTASRPIKHKWSSSGHKSIFAIENSNSGRNLTDIKYSLDNNESYWAVAWLDNNEETISVFEKKPLNQSDVFKVRIFANASLEVVILGNDNTLPNTVSGEASDTYTLNGCADLYVGGKEIDLCALGDFGKSYLAVVNKDGLINYSQE